MRQVFRTRPWVLPREPDRFVDYFKRYGRETDFPKDGFIPHGGVDGEIALLLDGLVSFAFTDNQSNHHIFAIVLPGRTIGDLDALNPSRVNVLAECIRPSRVILLKNRIWRECMRESIENMELYADLSILKEECILEGAFANFTMELDMRLRVLIYAILQGCGIAIQPHSDGHACGGWAGQEWIECPLELTVTEFARIVGANRSWVSTKISEWIDEGLMRKSGRSIACHPKLFANVHDWMRSPDNVRPTSIDLP